MMKKLLILTIAALLALTTVTGCLSPENGSGSANPTKVPLSEIEASLHPLIPDDGDVSFGDNDAEAVDILNRPAFVEQLSVPGGSTRESYYTVITDYDKLCSLIGDPTGRIGTEITRDTFIADFVVAVFVTVNTGGYSFDVEHAENDSHTVNVAVKVTPPVAGTAVTQAFETRCILVGFDAADYYDDLVYEVTVNGEAAPAREHPNAEYN